jgi:tryptophan-rich sensory protein
MSSKESGMTRPSSILSSRAVQGYYSLLVACGIGLLFSIPPTTRVAQLMEPHWEPPPQTFFVVYMAITALLGLARGSASASWGRVRWNTISSLAALVLFGQFLVLPHLLFSRALLPGRDAALFVLVAYATLVALMFSLISLRLELWGTARRTRPFVLQYTVFGLILIVPWVLSFIARIPPIVVILSPIGATLRIMRIASATENAVAFAFVLLMISIQLLRIRRFIRRTHAV